MSIQTIQIGTLEYLVAEGISAALVVIAAAVAMVVLYRPKQPPSHYEKRIKVFLDQTPGLLGKPPMWCSWGTV